MARECALDLAADGVVYAESRFAPELHVEGGLSLPEVVEAVLEGLREGEAEAAAAGTPIRMVSLLTAMRHAAKSDEIAELAIRYRDQGVGGFDIAGAEAGFPPSRHLSAFEYLRRENAHFTIHAGEAFGLPSIWEAIQWCGADRLGHGVRIVDDITSDGDTHTLGLLAAYVRDRRIPLEMCPTSNLQTGAAESIAAHPITLLKDLRFRVTINTDNRLMSGHVDVARDAAARRRGRLDARRPALGDDQRDEVGVHPVRRAARDHRAGRQAGVCRAVRRDLSRSPRAGRAAGRGAREPPRPACGRGRAGGARRARHAGPTRGARPGGGWARRGAAPAPRGPARGGGVPAA